MAPRRNVDRAAWETRSHREPMSRRVDRFERYDDGMVLDLSGGQTEESTDMTRVTGDTASKASSTGTSRP